MKKLDKYKKMIIGFLIAILSIAVIYTFVIIGEIRSSGPSTDDSSFPYFIIFSSWQAIWIPIIARKRQEVKEKEKELENQLEE